MRLTSQIHLMFGCCASLNSLCDSRVIKSAEMSPRYIRYDAIRVLVLLQVSRRINSVIRGPSEPAAELFLRSSDVIGSQNSNSQTEWKRASSRDVRRTGGPAETRWRPCGQDKWRRLTDDQTVTDLQHTPCRNCTLIASIDGLLHAVFSDGKMSKFSFRFWNINCPTETPRCKKFGEGPNLRDRFIAYR